MPNGNVHVPASAAVAIIAPAVALWYGVDVPVALSISAGCITGIIITPDLDLINPIRKIPLVGFAWGILWWPYRAAVPHRSTLSHTPIMGTVIRIMYLSIWALIIFSVFHLSPVIPSTITWWGFGLMLSDFVHITLDTFLTSSKSSQS